MCYCLVGVPFSAEIMYKIATILLILPIHVLMNSFKEFVLFDENVNCTKMS